MGLHFLILYVDVMSVSQVGIRWNVCICCILLGAISMSMSLHFLILFVSVMSVSQVGYGEGVGVYKHCSVCLSVCYPVPVSNFVQTISPEPLM